MYFFKYLLLVTSVLCILFVGCTTNKTSVGVTAHCDSNLTDTYKELKTKNRNDPALSNLIQSFYKKTSPECHNNIVKLVMDDLFDIAYGSGIQDTSNTTFLLNLVNESNLTEANRIKALFILSSINLFVLQAPDSALSFLNQSKEGELGAFYNDTLAKGYNSLMANVMLQKSDLKKAAEYYVKSIELCERLRDSSSLAKSYANFGVLYTKMGQYRKAIEMQINAFNYFERNGSAGDVRIASQCIAINYAYLVKYDSALIYYNIALNTVADDKSNMKLKFDILFSIAGIYTGKNDYNKALVYYDKAKTILKEVNNPIMEQTFIMASTPAYAKLRNVDEELAKIKTYIPEFYQNKDLSNVRNCYQVLFHTSYVQDKYSDALHYYQKWDSIGHVLSMDENRQYIAELETKYQTEKKELKIKVQQKALQQKNTLNSFLLALLALGGLSTAFIVTRVKLKRNKQEGKLQQHYTRKLLENTEEERERIARDLHDGVSQELMILKNQVNNNHENVNGKIDLIINEIRMISRDLHPVMLDKIGLKSSIEHTCEQMMELNKLFISADVDYKGSLDKNKELQLYRIVQEGLNNIIKYANAQAAKISLLDGKENIMLRIEDNGQGFDVEAAIKNKKSFGILNIIQRSKALDGKAEFISSPTGTIIKIEVPKV